MAARAVTKLYASEIEPTGLGESQVSVLSAVPLFGTEGAPISQLADRLAMDRTTLTRTLQPLLAKKLLRSLPDAHDKRSRLISLTRLGEAKLVELLPRWQRAQAQIGLAMGTSALRALHAELGRLIAAADACPTPSAPSR